MLRRWNLRHHKLLCDKITKYQILARAVVVKKPALKWEVIWLFGLLHLEHNQGAAVSFSTRAHGFMLLVAMVTCDTGLLLRCLRIQYTVKKK